MAKILAIGIATLDIINLVDSYPDEDSEIRALSQSVSRGGNATNTLVVLSQLGHECHWAGVLINEPDTQLIHDDLNHYHINTSACRVLTNGKIPTSYITVSQQTGSRSIVHHRDCPEFAFTDFQQIQLDQFDWIHFEGRNIEQTKMMLEWLAAQHPDIPCSLEIEKPRTDIEILFSSPSVLMFSQDYASHHGYSDAETFLQSLPFHMTASCSWGNKGAWLSTRGKIIHSPAYPPLQVVDTLAAGDTFNAGLINGIINGLSIEQNLAQACCLAGQKCGQQGLANLTTVDV
ncbi:MAG: ketohexokinase [Methylophaga sp.]|nr:MAG: ketohexokinase [Methylophaga sp.]